MALEETVLSWLVGMQSFILFGFSLDVESEVQVRKFAYLELQLDDTKMTKASSDPSRRVSSVRVREFKPR